MVYSGNGLYPTHNMRSAYARADKGTESEQTTSADADRANVSGTKQLYKKVLEKNLDANIIYVIIDNTRYYRNAELIQWV